MRMDVYAGSLCMLWFICSSGYTFGYFQWDITSNGTVACMNEDAVIEWKYNSNESTLTFFWEKVGPPDISVANFFGGVLIIGSAYTGRISQTNPGSSSIILKSVTSADNGTYRCTALSSNIAFTYLIVAESPSALPYINKTADSLTCNPPQNEGIPSVETILMKNDGAILETLTAQSPGTYQCCIRGSAVRCLGSTSNTATEVCVNETISFAGPTTEPPEPTSSPTDKCDCPALPCVGENGFCVLWIIIIIVVVVVVVLVAVICIVWVVCRRKQKK